MHTKGLKTPGGDSAEDLAEAERIVRKHVMVCVDSDPKGRLVSVVKGER